MTILSGTKNTEVNGQVFEYCSLVVVPNLEDRHSLD